MNKFKLSLLFFSLLFFSGTAFPAYDGEYWIVEKGDTLYAVARAFYPKSPRSQAKLRKDIIALNQNVFASGARGLVIGLKLQLPESVTSVSKPSEKKIVQTQTKKKPQSISQQSVLLSTNQWLIKRGDTLYSIARYFYPKSNREQERLRKEIVNLNPPVFSQGANNMEVGLALMMPERLVEKPEQELIETPVVIQEPSPIDDRAPDDTISSAEIKQLPTMTMTMMVEESTDVITGIEPEEQVESTEQWPGFDQAHSSSKLSVAIGYSAGGDDALISSGGPNITFGSGVHLRFGYDDLGDNTQGYRLALGYQSDQVTANTDSGELKQIYLQSLYLYNTADSLFGIGLSYHDNIAFESTISAVTTKADFDAAAGLVVLYEYKQLFGSHVMGISHTSLDSKNSLSQAGVDLSRTEIYYRLPF